MDDGASDAQPPFRDGVERRKCLEIDANGDVSFSCKVKIQVFSHTLYIESIFNGIVDDYFRKPYYLYFVGTTADATTDATKNAITDATTEATTDATTDVLQMSLQMPL